MVKMYIDTPNGPINELRIKRLLYLAQYPRDHKRFYHQYYYLRQQGLVDWVIGTAFLTSKGRWMLEELQK